MQQDARGRHLLQPLAAGVSATLFILAVIVVAVVKGSQQLLGEGAHRGHQGLTEDSIPAQLQLRVCGRCRSLWVSCPWPIATPASTPTPRTSHTHKGPGDNFEGTIQKPKVSATKIDSSKADRSTPKLTTPPPNYLLSLETNVWSFPRPCPNPAPPVLPRATGPLSLNHVNTSSAKLHIQDQS